jgi:mono/diheme cytochrome c family protein
MKLRSAFLLVSLWLGCRHEKPNTIYMPDMVYSPAIKSQSPGSGRLPPKGSVHMHHKAYPEYEDADDAGKKGVVNPLSHTPEVVARGKVIFRTFCYPCHGSQGYGDGPVIPKFPKPPNLHSEKVKAWADASIFHVITKGQNLMPSYATQIREQDRWSVIHYIREMQRTLPAEPPAAPEQKKENA